MEDALPIRDDFLIPGHELWFTASRSGGPGGQHVNKTNSRVTLHWDLAHTTVVDEELRERLLLRLGHRLTAQGVLMVDVDTERSQFRNRELARQRLAQLVRAALREPRKRVPTKATQGSHRRRLAAKTLRGKIKQARQRPTGADD
ncbi:MAG: aminoacyl-tRNA hydrolase [Myxococcota bacterium]|nr:aminoacyl-tRNA hydrolase [Myxococcota bacterium]